MSLTERQLRETKPDPTRQFVLVDALGLELLLTPNGARVWRFRYRFAGERRRMTIGSYPDMGLAAARVEVARLRAEVLLGKDPAPAPASAAAAATRVACPHCSHVFSTASGLALASVEPEYEGIDAAVDSYLADHSPAWKPSTDRTYRSAIRSFTAWASSAGVLTVNDLTPRSLGSFRAHAVSAPRRVKTRGGSRHDVESTGERRSAETVNGQIRVVTTMLEALRRSGRLLLLTSDAITDNLRLLSAERTRPDPLKPGDLRQLITASLRHDAVRSGSSTTNESEALPIFPLVAVLLLAGLRLGEALRLTWADIDLEEQTIRVAAGKTYRERTVDLTVSPALVRLLASMRPRGRTTSRVFGWTQATALDARLRLIEEFDAPAFLWSTRNSRPGSRSAPTLRSTCGCYLTCAPSIFGSASVYMSAAQLGHSADVAQRHYLGTMRRISADATTLEAAMGIEDLLMGDGARLQLVTSEPPVRPTRKRSAGRARSR